MTIKCRVCEIAKHDWLAPKGYEPYCENLLINFKCRMCEGINNVRHHIQDEVFSGQAIECNICHNYIQYFDDDLMPDKDEFYYEDFRIINDFQDKCTIISFYNREESNYIELPLIEFSEKDHFLKRIKSLIIFL
jgi:hypothetical protein